MPPLSHARVYPKVSGLVARSENCKWYSSLPVVQLYRYFVSQSSEFCRHNPLCCFSTSVYFCCLFRYNSVRKLLDTPSYTSRANAATLAATHQWHMDPCHGTSWVRGEGSGRGGAANILNKQSRIADKGWPSSLGVGRGLTTPLTKCYTGYWTCVLLWTR
jgi:hypothetical protein